MDHYFDSEKATGDTREIKRAVNHLAGRVAALEGHTDVEPTGEPEAEEPEPEAPEGEIPLDFPHRKILERRGLLSVEDLQEKTVEDLIELEEIGEARASEIVEAREAL